MQQKLSLTPYFYDKNRSNFATKKICEILFYINIFKFKLNERSATKILKKFNGKNPMNNFCQIFLGRDGNDCCNSQTTRRNNSLRRYRGKIFFFTRIAMVDIKRH